MKRDRKLICHVEFDDSSDLQVVSINEGIELANGFKLASYHEQDCCESVYADWSSLEDTGFMGRELIDELFIYGQENLGIVLQPDLSNDYYAVNCYNSQNGYYSDQLGLVLSGPFKKARFYTEGYYVPNGDLYLDITKFKYDDIY